MVVMLLVGRMLQDEKILSDVCSCCCGYGGDAVIWGDAGGQDSR